MNHRALALIGLLFGTLAASAARAEECVGNPNALGTSRVITIDPQDYPRIGTVQYTQSLPLQDKEVVLTFDDGPMPPYTNRVLEVLAEQCVKANYFIIGRMARGYPDLLRQAHAAGHVIGTHSQNHPLAFERMPIDAVKSEIEQGIASVGAALGDRNAVAPFFRIPGLLRAQHVESYLQSRDLTAWSADVVADDWKHISAAEVVRRAIARLDEKGKGILLLHDIQPATALALPELLRQLKVRGYRIVQVAPAKRGEPTPMAAKTLPPTPPATPAAAVLAREIMERARVPVAAVPAPVQQVRIVRPAAGPAAAPAARESDEPPDRVAATRNDGTEDEARDEARQANASARMPDPAVPSEPVRPYAPSLKPAQSISSPGKLSSTEPGGWPRAITVPVPSAGGGGASSVARSNEAPEGRFQ